MNKHKIIAILPALNEEHNIGGVIAGIRAAVPGSYILVVDDGSTDRTGAKAIACGAHVVRLACTLGIGAAVQTGLIYAYRNGFDIAVQVDGDGQHDPSDIPRLTGPVIRGTSDLVIGSRYLERKGHQSSFQRRIGIKIFAVLISKIMHQPVTDPTSGFRAMGRKAIGLFSKIYPDDYPEPESLVISYLRRLRVSEVPVTMIKRKFGFSSIGAMRAVYYMIKVTLAILIDLCKQGYKEG